MVYKGYNKTYDFRKLKTIRLFGNDIRNNIINMCMDKVIWQSILKNVKLKQSRKIILI